MFYFLLYILGFLIFMLLIRTRESHNRKDMSFFMGFYLSFLCHDLIGFLQNLAFIANNHPLSLWIVSHTLEELGLLFLLFFLQSLGRFSMTPLLTALWTGLILTAYILPFAVYSLIPSLIRIAFFLYFAGHVLYLHLTGRSLRLMPSIGILVGRLLFCTGFFLLGIILELLEEIPQTRIYLTLLLVDFTPLFTICTGAIVTLWLREQKAPVPLMKMGLPVSPREEEVINMILAGETNSSIAERLFISESTVKKHINNIFRKLQIKSRWELLRISGRIHPKE